MGPDFYGEMHASNASITVPITAINTWVPIGSGLVSNHIESYAFNGSNALVSHIQGLFAIFLSLSVQCAIAGAVSAAIAVNGTPSPVQTQVVLAKSAQTCFSCADIIAVNPNDVVTVVLQNNSSITGITVNAVSLVALRIA